MEAPISNRGVWQKPCVRMLRHVSLCLAIASLLVALVADLGLYINRDFLPDEVRGLHPIAGTVGEISFQVGMLIIPCAMVLNFFGLPLSLFRRSLATSFLVALGGLLVSTLAWHINTDGLTRVRANPVRFHARKVTRLGTLLERYAKKHDGYLPIPGNWCETLTEFDPNAEGYLSYPTGKSVPPGFSSFALNAAVEGKRLTEVPGSVVLLFGTRPAQNPIGDYQLLAPDGDNRIGALVLFADLHVEFVGVDDFGSLRWEP